MNPITPKGWRFLALLFMALCVFLVGMNLWTLNRMEQTVRMQELTIEHYKARLGESGYTKDPETFKRHIESLIP